MLPSSPGWATGGHKAFICWYRFWFFSEACPVSDSFRNARLKVLQETGALTYTLISTNYSTISTCGRNVSYLKQDSTYIKHTVNIQRNGIDRNVRLNYITSASSNWEWLWRTGQHVSWAFVFISNIKPFLTRILVVHLHIFWSRI